VWDLLAVSLPRVFAAAFEETQATPICSADTAQRLKFVAT